MFILRSPYLGGYDTGQVKRQHNIRTKYEGVKMTNICKQITVHALKYPSLGVCERTYKQCRPSSKVV
jgi:hypothetical protein